LIAPPSMLAVACAPASPIGLPAGVPPTHLIGGAYWITEFVDVVGDAFAGVVVAVFHVLFALEGVGFHYFFDGSDFVVVAKAHAADGWDAWNAGWRSNRLWRRRADLWFVVGGSPFGTHSCCSGCEIHIRIHFGSIVGERRRREGWSGIRRRWRKSRGPIIGIATPKRRSRIGGWWRKRRGPIIIIIAAPIIGATAPWLPWFIVGIFHKGIS